MIDIKDLIPGTSYACKFKHGEYESIGLLLTRDIEQNLVKIRDTQTSIEFIVPFSDIWDIDYVKWTDSPEESGS